MQKREKEIRIKRKDKKKIGKPKEGDGESECVGLVEDGKGAKKKESERKGRREGTKRNKEW